MVTVSLQTYMTSLAKIQSVDPNLWLPRQLSSGRMFYGLLLPGQLYPGQYIMSLHTKFGQDITSHY